LRRVERGRKEEKRMVLEVVMYNFPRVGKVVEDEEDEVSERVGVSGAVSRRLRLQKDTTQLCYRVEKKSLSIAENMKYKI